MAADAVNPAFAAKLEQRASARASGAGMSSCPCPSEDLPVVLVVDDEPEITRSVAELLERDYQVLTACSADEALRLLDERPVTVVLTDQRMPGGTGSELLARSLDIAPETTRILFTGYSDISAVIEAVNEGHVYRYVTKPWRPDELRAVVSQGLERYRLLAENRRLLEDLTRANLDLEIANRELQELTYSMAHELRSPLRALDGFSLAILEDHEECLDEAGSDYLRRIRAASQRMAELLDAQVVLARTGQRPIAVGEVDVTSQALRLVEGLKERDPSRVLESTVAEAMTAQTDQVIARLVLEQLLDNSWKFTASRSTARIHVGCETVGGERAFFVNDNGAGFDESYAHKLFTPFERLHPVEQFAGMGIGLARVRRMLERVGGRCWAEGETGVGATVWFTLEKGV